MNLLAAAEARQKANADIEAKNRAWSETVVDVIRKELESNFEQFASQYKLQFTGKGGYRLGLRGGSTDYMLELIPSVKSKNLAIQIHYRGSPKDSYEVKTVEEWQKLSPTLEADILDRFIPRI